MNQLLLYALGGCGGIVGVIICLIVLGLWYKPNRKRIMIRRPQNARPCEKTRETVNWMNVTLDRLNNVKFDQVVLRTICDFVSKTIQEHPNRPDFLTEAKISPLKPAKQTPFFSDFVMNPTGDNTTLSVCLNYQGSPSLAITASASHGPADLPKLFTVSINVEFILELLVARITLEVDENQEMWVKIGNDLIIDVRARPLYDNPQNQHRHVESISAWLSNTILKTLRGKSVRILGPIPPIAAE